MMRISVRAGDGSAGSGTGNMFGLQQCPLGTDLADPVALLEAVLTGFPDSKGPPIYAGATGGLGFNYSL